MKRDKHLTVGGDKNEEVTGTVSLKAQNIQNKVSQNYALEADSEVHIKAGMSVVIETGSSMTMKVGGNFISINSGGIFIKGTMVMINSGGAAMGGSGSRPNAPEEPLEADNADPGQSVAYSPQSPPPPRPAENLSPLAKMLASASKDGTAFGDP